MYYEINVSANGKHFFATAERSIRDLSTLKCVYSTMVNKFPKHEGFEITVTENTLSGKWIDMQELEIR
jgi:hypothetical protein